MTNNVILSLLNARFIFARDEQWRSLSNVFADHAEPHTLTPEHFPHPAFMPDSVVNLQAGSGFDQEREFQCDQPPCGFKVRGLSLQKNGIYELSFGVSSRDKHNPS